jgi:hypothetical protein
VPRPLRSNCYPPAEAYNGSHWMPKVVKIGQYKVEGLAFGSLFIYRLDVFQPDVYELYLPCAEAMIIGRLALEECQKIGDVLFQECSIDLVNFSKEELKDWLRSEKPWVEHWLKCCVTEKKCVDTLLYRKGKKHVTTAEK